MLPQARCLLKGKVLWGVLFLVMVGCSSTPDMPFTKEMPFEQNGIKLNLLADSSMNLYEGEPHTLVLCIYQLNAAEAFRELVQTQEGVGTLLNCTSFGETVTTSKRIILHPKEERTIDLDRYKGTQFLGLVTGYYESSPARITRLYKIPMNYYKEGFWMWKDKYRWPKKMVLTLHLESRGLRNDKGYQQNLQLKVHSERG